MTVNLEGCLFFKDMTEEEIQNRIEKIEFEVEVYPSKQNINDFRNFKSEIGIILLGEAEVIKANSSGKRILLNTLKEKDVFGIATLFTKEFSYPTEIITKEKCEVLFINENELIRLFNMDERILKNYITYVNSRIFFLNNKIESFIHDNVRAKIEYFLENKASEQNNKGYIEMKYSKKALADYLCISRPSLYRVLKDMENEGLLVIEKDRIQLLKKNKDERENLE